jgi:hypothetical protein
MPLPLAVVGSQCRNCQARDTNARKFLAETETPQVFEAHWALQLTSHFGNDSAASIESRMAEW